MGLRSWLSAFALSGDFFVEKTSDNVGSDFLDVLERSGKAAEKPARAGTPLRQSPRLREQEDKGKGVLLVDRSRQAGPDKPAPAGLGVVPDWLRSVHAADLDRAATAARKRAAVLGKPWQLEADRQTVDVLASIGDAGKVSEKTAHAYRRAYAVMLEAGHQPHQHANSRQHFNFLRSAWRFCEAEQIRTLRRAADKSRRAGDLESAQRRTVRAFERATIFDAMFLQVDRPTWATKAAELKQQNQKPVKKSKRFGARAPSADALLFALQAKDPKAGARHDVRAVALALFGMRPGELTHEKGVELAVETVKGRRYLVAGIYGAKVDEKRGQQVRRCYVPVSTGKGGRGVASRWLAGLVEASAGPLVVRSTDADIRSLNRALNRRREGLSCYSFRHAIGSDLKASKMDETERAAFMGHRSTASIEYYGHRVKGGGGKGLRAIASDRVRVVPHTRDQKRAARAARVKPVIVVPKVAPRLAVQKSPTVKPTIKPVVVARRPRPPPR